MKTNQKTNGKVEVLIAEDSPTQAAQLAHLLEQRGYLVTAAANGREADAAAVAAMIQGHHQFTPCRGPHARLAEAFRRADWHFVSLGLLPMGVPRAWRRALLRAFPNAGFHATLLRLIGREFLRRPWRPLPMMRW